MALTFVQTQVSQAGGSVSVNGSGGIALAPLSGQGIIATSAVANGFVVGRQGATSPQFQVDTSAATVVTGLLAKGAAAGAGYALSLIGGNAAENLTLDAKGTGTLTLQGTATGAVIIGNGLTLTGALGVTGALALTTPSANALVVGRQGSTSPQFNVDASAATVVTGLNLAGAAAGGGVALTTIGGNAAEDLSISAATSGTLHLGNIASQNVQIAKIGSTPGTVSFFVAPLSSAAIYVHSANQPSGWTQLLRVDPNWAPGAGAVSLYAMSSAAAIAASANTSASSQVNGVYQQITVNSDAFIHNEPVSGFKALVTYSGTNQMVGALSGIITEATSATTSTGSLVEIGGAHLNGTHLGTGTATLVYGTVARATLGSSGGAADGNVTSMMTFYSEMYLSGVAATPGVVANAYQYWQPGPNFTSASVTSRLTNFYGFYGAAAFNTYNHTTSTAGLTLTATGALITVGNQSATAASTVTNYGVHLTGNGGTGSGGATLVNWALLSDSTANSSLLGSLSIGTNTASSGMLTVLGGAISLNDSSNFNTTINTGNSTGSVTIGNGAAGVITIATKANTAATHLVTDGTNNQYALDTRTGVSGVSVHTFSATGASFAGAAGNTYSLVNLPAFTLTQTGSTLVTALAGLSLNIGSPTVTDVSAETVTTASSVKIGGPLPTGSVTFTNSFALDIPTFATNGTTAAALRLAPPTGAGANYALAIVSGNVLWQAATILQLAAATAVAMQVTDGTATMQAYDTRIATDNVTTNTLGAGAISYASGGGSTYTNTKIKATTVNWTGGVGVTAAEGLQLYVDASTITAGQATTVTLASGAIFAGLKPGTNTTLTTGIHVHLLDGPTKVGTYTNQVGIKVDALTQGATLNTAIWVQNPIQVGGAALATNNQIHTASQGAGTTQLFIGNASINVTSDARLKTDVVNTERDPMAIFNQLRVVDYTWNDPADQAVVNRNSRGRWTGMIAQEMVDVVPWIIAKPGDPEKDLYFVEYEHLVPLMVKGFQDVDSRLKRLEARLY